MRQIKMLGLALVAVLATMALLGAGSASAKVGLCKEKVEVCPAEQQYKAGQEFEAVQESQTSKIKDESFFGTSEINCQKSVIKGTLVEKIEEEQQWKGEITSATWTECKKENTTQGFIENFTMTGTQLPWTAHLEQDPNAAQSEYKGILWIGPRNANGQPGITMNGETPFQTLTVKAKEKQNGVGNAEWIKAAVTSATQPAQIIYNQTPLKDNVGGQAFWTETYNVTKPSPLYLTQQG